MTARARRAAAAAALLVVALSSIGTSFAAGEPQRYSGRSLSEALRLLQAHGLRIVFTSVIVTPDLIVRVEPRTTSPRAQLDELLAPHGLEARDGPGGVIQIVEGPARSPDAPIPLIASLQGRVLDAFTGAPIANAIVRVDKNGSEARTDAAGRFLIGRLTNGSHHVHASAAEYAPVTRTVDLGAGTQGVVILQLVPSVSALEEYVSVRGPWGRRQQRGVSAESSLDRQQMQGLYGTLGDDPMRAVQALPRVTAVDDYRAEFAVRGSPFRQVEVVIDGISTPWLRHSPIGRGASGSLAMFGSQVVDDATLRTGAYARRYGERLGPQLDVTLREGSRMQTGFRTGIGGTSALFVGEGPLSGSSRGSWLVAARQSLLEWPTEDSKSTRTPFGFSDGVGKIVYDVRATQQVGLTVIAGTATVDEEDNLTPNDLARGTTNASAVSLSWRSTARSGLTVTQRAYFVRQRFRNEFGTGEISDRGGSEELVYRAIVSRPLAAGLLEGGAQVARMRVDDFPRNTETASPGAIESQEAVAREAAWDRSGYAHFTWAPLPSLTLSPGIRIAGSTLAANPTFSPWLLGEWALGRNWTLSASGGVSHQLPDLRYALRSDVASAPRPERSTHFDVALGQRVAPSVRWQITLFNRRETDILREPDTTFRLAPPSLKLRRTSDDVLTQDGRYVNALTGTSRGVEFEVERRSASGISGWAAYSYGKTRHTDGLRAETFPSDFDQRHTVNLFGTYRVGTAGFGATYRFGSNFPVPGYLAVREGRLFAASTRNQVRLPLYARLDLRADYGLTYLGRRMTCFVEMWNATNRTNIGLGRGTVDGTTGEVVGITERLSKRRVFAGVLVDLGGR